MHTSQRGFRLSALLLSALAFCLPPPSAFGQVAFSNYQIVTGSATGYIVPTTVGTFTETVGSDDTICLALTVTSLPTTQFVPRLEIYQGSTAYGGAAFDDTGTHACVRGWTTTGTYTVKVYNSANYPSVTGTFAVQYILAGQPYSNSAQGGGVVPLGSPTPGLLNKWNYQLWTVPAKASDHITIAASNITGQSSGLYLAFQLYDPTGAELATTDNNPATMTFNATLTGNYTFAVFQDPSSIDPISAMTYDIAVTGSTALPTAAKLNGGHCLPCTGLAAASQTQLAPASITIAAVNSVGASPSGDPIDTASGNLFEQEVDYATAGPNPLAFIRYYNSLANQNNLYLTALGPNWRSNYDRYLRLNSPTLTQAERPDGQVINFSLVSSVWTPDTDSDYTLTNSGSTWTLTGPDDTVETYTGSSGVAILQTIKLRDGYTMTMNYTGGLLTTVTDSYSRTLTLSYTGAILTGLATPETLALTYGYTTTAGKSLLTSVTYNTIPSTNKQYLYETSSLPFSLTGITDENGHRYATWAYDYAGRATSSNLGTTLNADYTQISYDDSTGNRTVTQSLGEVDTYRFTTLQGVPKINEIDRAANSPVAAATRLFTYDSNGYLATAQDWDGNSSHYTNNNHGLPTQIIEGYGSSVARTTTIAYDAAWSRLPHAITTPGLTTTLNYDTSTGNLLARTLTDTTTTTAPYATNGMARTWTFTWANFLLASVKGPRTDLNATTGFGYDGSGALTSISNALGQATRITAHTGGGRPLTIVDPNGVTTQLAYDGRLRQTSSTLTTANGQVTSGSTYDAAGNLLSTTLPDGSTLTNTYDTAHRLTKVTDSLGNYTSYTLDAMGDRTQTSIYKNGGTLTWQRSGTFDALGRPLVNTAGAGQTTTQTYDPNGNVLTVADGLGHTTSNSYDALNRLGASTDANGGVTTPGYDAHDRVISVADANDNTTTYARDGFGDVIGQTSPDSGNAVFHYDGDRNLTSKTDALGIVTNQTFDALDRPLATIYPAHAAENVAYTYDQTVAGFTFGVGRLTSVTDAAGALTRTYDERGNLLAEKRVNGMTTLSTFYTYDGAGRVASMTYPDGALVTYQHDAAGYLGSVSARPSVSAPTTVIATLNHEPFGPLSGATYGNGTAETWTFDAAYRPTSIIDALSGAGLQNLTYAYDSANNVRSITDALNTANSQTLGYDVINRLTSAVSGSGGYGSFGWTYDKVGNRLTQVQGGATTSYGYTSGTNRLATITTSTASAMQRLPLPRTRGQSGTHFTMAAQRFSRIGPAHSAPQPPTFSRGTSSMLTGLLGWPMLFAGFAGVVSLRRRTGNHRGNSRLLATLSFSACCTGGATLLNGCGSASNPSSAAPPVTRLAMGGTVHGGQQPVTGATVQLYAVGTMGDGSAAIPLLGSAVLTDQHGNFSITGDYSCPSAGTEVYLLATGGNPGLSVATNNTALAMTAALGPCGALSASTYIVVNEVTTVGSLAALYPYMTSATHLGSGSGDAPQLAAAFARVNEYVNTATGTTPGPALPAGYYASSIEIQTLGNIIAACINSAGGIAGDGTACGTLFTLATPSGGQAPTDTIAALLDIMNNPARNVAALFNLGGAVAPFQPTLSAAPASWALPILASPATPTFSPAGGTYTGTQSVTIADSTAGAAIYYTTNGATPTTSSTRYTGPIAIASAQTIAAIAAVSGSANSPVATAAYVINIASGVTVVTNANGNITSIPPANSAAYATFAYNNANRLASVTGSPMAATFVYDWAGQRFSKTNGGTPPTLYSYSQDGAVISENNGGTVTDYIYADGRPIAILQPGATPAASQVNYVIADRLGTPQRVTNSSGATVWNATYQLFGTTTGTSTASITQNLRFPGQLADGETGFNYNLNRDYMPNLGRYLESDPIGLGGGSYSTYAYAAGNPVKRVDPTGLITANQTAQLVQDVDRIGGGVSELVTGGAALANSELIFTIPAGFYFTTEGAMDVYNNAARLLNDSVSIFDPSCGKSLSLPIYPTLLDMSRNLLAYEHASPLLQNVPDDLSLASGFIGGLPDQSISAVDLATQVFLNGTLPPISTAPPANPQK